MGLVGLRCRSDSTGHRIVAATPHYSRSASRSNDSAPRVLVSGADCHHAGVCRPPGHLHPRYSPAIPFAQMRAGTNDEEAWETNGFMQLLVVRPRGLEPL